MNVYRCDSCKTTIYEKDITLNMTSPITFQNKRLVAMNNGKRVQRFQKFEPGDKCLSCPKCGKLHLYGFELVT